MREDFQQFRQKALQEALAYPGLTKEEYSVMCALVHDDSGTPDEAASYCLLYCPDKNAAPYLAAIDTLIEKGYVRVLDEETISAMRAEIQRTNPLFLDYLMPSNCYYPGNVDLTTEGYFVFRDISAKLNGGLHTELGESLCIDDV